MTKKILAFILLISSIHKIYSQAHAFDLISCQSTDGVNWTNNALFQDSSGVPSLTQHSTGAVYCAFQWFPAPQSPTNTAHDKIAIKKSTDNGLTWGSPTLAVFTGSPAGYKRPFDPTIVIADNGNIRMYFSSSKTGTLMALDSTVHCYSAISTDGVNYTWEPGVRVAVADSVTIDPAVIKIGSTWHYACPRAAPQHGAHHFISNDGLAWTRTMSILSDNNHNFTGNLMSELPGGGTGYKFYGSPNPQINAIWYKTTNDGLGWNPTFQNCTGAVTASGINADPAVIKFGANNYLMVYVGKQSLINAVKEISTIENDVVIYPNPSSGWFNIKSNLDLKEIIIYDLMGKKLFQKSSELNSISHQLTKGVYMIEIKASQQHYFKKLIVE